MVVSEHSLTCTPYIYMRPKKYSDEDLLSLTRTCLLREGGHISTQVIADELGVSQAMLFKRFGTKNKLLCSALSPSNRIRSLLAVLAAEPSSDPVLKQLSERCRVVLEFYNFMVPGWTILHALGLKTTNHCNEERPPVQARKAMTKWVAALQQRGRIRTCYAESTALALIGSMQHRAFRRHILNDLTMQESDSNFIQSTVELFWLGLMPRGE